MVIILSGFQTLHQTRGDSQLQDLTFHHPEVVISGPSGPDRLRRIDIDYFGRWSARDDGRPSPPPRDQVFTFDQIGGMEGVEKWLRIAPQYRAALGRLGASRYSDGQYVSDMLLHRTAALESFDRLRSGTSQSKLRTRLRRCVDFAGPDFAPFIGDAEVWLRRVATARDDAAHQLDPMADDSIDFMIVESLYWLFVICILKESMISREAIDNLTETQQFKWVARRVHRLTAL